MGIAGTVIHNEDALFRDSFIVGSLIKTSEACSTRNIPSCLCRNHSTSIPPNSPGTGVRFSHIGELLFSSSYRQGMLCFAGAH